jgi:ubiquinone biosynthesis protein
MMLELPYQVHDTLEQVRDGQIEVGFRHEGLEQLIRRMDLVFNRIGIAVVAVGGAITSAMLASVANGVGSFFGILSVVGLSLSGLLSIWLVWGVFRSGRL